MTVRSIALTSIVAMMFFCAPATVVGREPAIAWRLYPRTPLGLGDCGLSEPLGGGVVEIDVVLYSDGCAQQLFFRVASDGGFTGTYIGESSSWGSYFGNAVDGVSMFNYEGTEGYASVLRVEYMTYGTSDQCSWLYVGPHPDHGGVFVYDCYGTVIDVTEESVRRQFWIGGSYDCALGTCTPEIVGTQATTWGRIKAMYGD